MVTLISACSADGRARDHLLVAGSMRRHAARHLGSHAAIARPAPVSLHPIAITPTCRCCTPKARILYLNLKERANMEVGRVTVEPQANRDIFEYLVAVFAAVLDQNDDGFLLLLALKYRKYYTQFAYHLEAI